MSKAAALSGPTPQRVSNWGVWLLTAVVVGLGWRAGVGLMWRVARYHLDGGLAEVAGQRGTVGAGAVHTGPSQYPERARPAQQRVVAGSTGRKRLGVPQHAQRGDNRCH